MFALNLEKWLSKRESQGQEGIFASKPKAEKKVSPKTQETTAKLIGTLEKNIGVNDLPESATTEQLLTGIYSLMLKNTAEDMRNDELDDNSNDSRHFLAQRRHQEILDVLASTTAGKMKMKRGKKKPQKIKGEDKKKKGSVSKIAVIGGLGALGLMATGSARAASEHPLGPMAGSFGSMFDTVLSKYESTSLTEPKNVGAELSEGLRSKIVSGERSHEKQREMYEETVRAGRPGIGPGNLPVAKPGYSAHEHGNAIDLPRVLSSEEIKELHDKGWYRPYPYTDPVHWEKIKYSKSPMTNNDMAKSSPEMKNDTVVSPKPNPLSTFKSWSSSRYEQLTPSNKMNTVNITAGQKIDTSSKENQDLHAMLNDPSASVSVINNQTVVNNPSQTYRTPQKEDDRSAYEKKSKTR